MLVHTVLFWLRKDLSADKITEFRKGLETLKHIESAQAVYIGSPAKLGPRPGIRLSTYDFCLTVILSDIEAHDNYQSDPIHKQFIKTYSSCWKRVRVYDAD